MYLTHEIYNNNELCLDSIAPAGFYKLLFGKGLTNILVYLQLKSTIHSLQKKKLSDYEIELR